MGVVNSPSTSPANTGTPLRRMAVAGAGTGRTPWAHLTWPYPVLSGEATILSALSLSMSRHVPTTSATASMAPTSWKWTSSTGLPWTSASAEAIEP